MKSYVHFCFQTGALPHSYRLISVVSHIGSTSSSGKWTSVLTSPFVNKAATICPTCYYLHVFVRCRLTTLRKTYETKDGIDKVLAY